MARVTLTNATTEEWAKDGGQHWELRAGTSLVSIIRLGQSTYTIYNNDPSGCHKVRDYPLGTQLAALFVDAHEALAVALDSANAAALAEYELTRNELATGRWIFDAADAAAEVVGRQIDYVIDAVANASSAADLLQATKDFNLCWRLARIDGTESTRVSLEGVRATILLRCNELVAAADSDAVAITGKYLASIAITGRIRTLLS